MKKVLDLLEEFGALNDAKVESCGYLAPADELRWNELKEFYDRLMSFSRPGKGLDESRFLAYDIREGLKHRGRLRVRTDMDIFFRYRNGYVPSRAVNVSRGGMFVGSDVLLKKGTRLVLYMPNLGPEYQELFETRSEVAWSTPGISRSDLPRGMGVRFYQMKPRAARQLDAYIVESLEELVSSARARRPISGADGKAPSTPK